MKEIFNAKPWPSWELVQEWFKEYRKANRIRRNPKHMSVKKRI